MAAQRTVTQLDAKSYRMAAQLRLGRWSKRTPAPSCICTMHHDGRMVIVTYPPTAQAGRDDSRAGHG
jgi:hypothetical protein